MPAQNADVNLAMEVEHGTMDDELQWQLPSLIQQKNTGTTISLEELLETKDKDCQLSNPPLEFSEVQKGFGVNEEFIFVAGRSKLKSNYLTNKMMSNLSDKLRAAFRNNLDRTNGSQSIEDCPVLIVADGCPGIIDTGASKSVIG